MADNPYSSVALSNYNLNPPPDDGTAGAGNQLEWDKHKTKIGDPLKNLGEGINTNAVAAGALTVVNGADQTNTLAGSIGFTSSELTIATGVVTVTRSFHTIDTEADAATDNLETITATSVATGTIISLTLADAARVVTVKDTLGNIELINNDDVVLDLNNPLVLQFDGTNWQERSRPSDKNTGVDGPFTVVDTFQAKTVSSISGTVVAASIGFNHTATWNAAADTFFGQFIDIINTASSASSRLIRYQVGSVTKFDLDLSGNLEIQGNYTAPNAPAFLGNVSALISDLTGNGTAATIIFGQEIFDQGADYNPVTGIFTAPVTGKYQFDTWLQITGFVAGTNTILEFVASNRTVRVFNELPNPTSATYSVNGGCLIDMDSGDTVKVVLTASGEASDVQDIEGASGSPVVSGFSGHLVA